MIQRLKLPSRGDIFGPIDLNTDASKLGAYQSSRLSPPSAQAETASGVYAPPEITHPATHPHSLGYALGYICGLVFWIGSPLFVIGWIVSLVWKAIH